MTTDKGCEEIANDPRYFKELFSEFISNNDQSWAPSEWSDEVFRGLFAFFDKSAMEKIEDLESKLKQAEQELAKAREEALKWRGYYEGTRQSRDDCQSNFYKEKVKTETLQADLKASQENVADLEKHLFICQGMLLSDQTKLASATAERDKFKKQAESLAEALKSIKFNLIGNGTNIPSDLSKIKHNNIFALQYNTNLAVQQIEQALMAYSEGIE